MSSTGLINGMAAQENSSQITQLLWGTNINTTEVQTKLRNFINTFVIVNEESDDFTQEPYYIEQLKQIKETETYMLDVDCDHIYQYDQQLYRQIENYPSDIIPIFDLVATHCFKELFLYGMNNQNQFNNEANMIGTS